MVIPYSLPSYVFGPDWFHGFDSIIELFAIIICVLLLYFSYRCFSYTSEKRYLYFSTAFLSLTLAFIAKIFGTLAFYMPALSKSGVGAVVNSAGITAKVLNSYAFLAHIFFMTAGIMVLFLIISRLTWDDLRVILLFGYFIFVATWLGAIHYQLFYLTVGAMLFLVTYSYFKSYHETNFKKTLLVAISFLILFIAQGFFIFAIYSAVVYVAAQILQLIGFLCLLALFFTIFRRKPKSYITK